MESLSFSLLSTQMCFLGARQMVWPKSNDFCELMSWSTPMATCIAPIVLSCSTGPSSANNVAVFTYGVMVVSMAFAGFTGES